MQKRILFNKLCMPKFHQLYIPKAFLKHKKNQNKNFQMMMKLQNCTRELMKMDLIQLFQVLLVICCHLRKRITHQILNMGNQKFQHIMVKWKLKTSHYNMKVKIKMVEPHKNNKFTIKPIKQLMQQAKVVLAQMMLSKLHTVLPIKLDREILMTMFTIHKVISLKNLMEVNLLPVISVYNVEALNKDQKLNHTKPLIEKDSHNYSLLVLLKTIWIRPKISLVIPLTVQKRNKNKQQRQKKMHKMLLIK